MPNARLVVVTLTLVLMGTMAATTSAALPEFLPGNAGEKLSGTGGASTLEVSPLEKLKCSGSTVNAEIVGVTKKEASATFTHKGVCVQRHPWTIVRRA